MDETSYGIKKILFFLAIFLVAIFHCSYGQTGLSIGDVAFTGINVDGDEDFAIVALSDISGGENIHFSNEEWDGSSFSGSGGHLTWIVPSGGISAGTIVIFNDTDGDPTVTAGSIEDDANTGLSSAGDVIYAYTGPSQDSPSTFLGAIATAADEYNQPDGTEGTLENTGLTQGTTAILLPDNIDNAEYIGSRSGNTPNGYRNLLNDIGTEEATDDNWDIYNGEDTPPFPPFNDQNFEIVNPPTIHFTTSEDTAAEDGGSIDLAVELAEATGEAVDVDVAFLSNASTANGSDIGNYSKQNVSFSAGASSGDTKTMTINISDNSSFDGNKKAVFELQNISTGTLIDPTETTLIIEDDEQPDVVINEFLADPPMGITGDANGDGIRDNGDDEFIELVNNSSSDIDISAWQLSDEAGSDPAIRHSFPSGTVLPAGQAVVVFGGGDPDGNFGGAIVQTASDGTVSLSNGGGYVTLMDDEVNVVQSIPYGDEGGAHAGDDQSVTRDPDITGSFVKHSNVSNSGGTIFSPGTKADGTVFGSKFAIAFRGQEGWRMVASPVQSATFDDFFSDFWIQGFQGADDPSGDGTLFSWNEPGGGRFGTIANMGDDIVPGKGYIVYAFKDDAFNTPGVQGGFPKVIRTDGTENSGTVSVSVSSNDADGSEGIDGTEGWNLLGNPFGTDISVGAVISALEDVNPNVNAHVYIWDHDGDNGNGDYVTLSDGDQLAPFQAFFIRYTTSGVNGSANFTRSSLAANQGTEYYKQKADELTKSFDLQLHEEGGKHYFDDYTVEFSNKGSVEMDRYDAYKLFSLNADAISLFSMAGSNQLQKNVLPRDFDDKITVPLSFDANGRTSLKFSWKKINELPSDWDVRLVDHKMNATVDLRTRNSYQFTVSKAKINQQKFQANEDTLRNKVKTKDINDNRFELIITASSQQSDDSNSSDSKGVALNPNYPNPFSSSTTIPFELDTQHEVTLTVWNMIGQKIATLVDHETMRGAKEIPCPMGKYPSGIYIARLQVDGKMYIRKMTLIK